MNTQKVWQWLAGIAGSLLLISAAVIASMWNNQRDLLNWRAREWPLEKQLLLVGHEQVKAQVEVLENRLDRLENEK